MVVQRWFDLTCVLEKKTTIEPSFTHTTLAIHTQELCVCMCVWVCWCVCMCVSESVGASVSWNTGRFLRGPLSDSKKVRKKIKLFRLLKKKVVCYRFKELPDCVVRWYRFNLEHTDSYASPNMAPKYEGALARLAALWPLQRFILYA